MISTEKREPTKITVPPAREKIKVIYHWPGSGNTAPLAAALHLGLVSGREGRAMLKELNLPFAGGFPGKNLGVLILAGKAKDGELVYILPRGNKPELVLKVLERSVELFGEDKNLYRFVDCEEYLKGETGSRKQDLYGRLARMVAAVKEELEG